jgi:N-acetylmuramoyl-L-alanine amidase
MPGETGEGNDRHRDHSKTPADADLLARFIWIEARGERVEGKLAVAHVVLNRVRARSNYGGTIQEVILNTLHSMGSSDDDPWCGNEFGLATDDREFALCRAIAELASRGHLKNDPTGGAIHFHRINSKPSWVSTLIFQRQIGNLVFYREPLTRSFGDHGVPVLQSAMGRQLRPVPNKSNGNGSRRSSPGSAGPSSWRRSVIPV